MMDTNVLGMYCYFPVIYLVNFYNAKLNIEHFFQR